MNKFTELTAQLPHYWKTVMGLIPLVTMVGGEIIQAVADGGADGTFSWEDLYKIVAAGVAAYLVYRKANQPYAAPVD